MLAPRKTRGKAIKQEPQAGIPEDITDADFVPEDVAIESINDTLDLKKYDEFYEPAKKTSRKGRRAPSMNAKAIKAREKALGEKFVEVTSKLDNVLEKDDGIVVDCFYHAPTKLATMDKTYNYNHLMNLRSNSPFVLVKQVLLDQGLYAGHVAIIMKQSRPFPFMGLPIAIRAKIYNFMLKHDNDIAITSRQNSRVAYSPTYRGKNNLSILATCKQVRAEAAPIVYSQVFHFTGTEVIMNYLLQIRIQNRGYLRSIRSETYNSASAKAMFHLLEDSPHIERISFAHVSSNEKPVTAIKNIFNDASQWLLSLDKANPIKGLEILGFDDTAFHLREKSKSGEVTVTQWGPGEQLEFLKGLKMKLKQAAAAAAKKAAK